MLSSGLALSLVGCVFSAHVDTHVHVLNERNEPVRDATVVAVLDDGEKVEKQTDETGRADFSGYESESVSFEVQGRIGAHAGSSTPEYKLAPLDPQLVAGITIIVKSESPRVAAKAPSRSVVCRPMVALSPQACPAPATVSTTYCPPPSCSPCSSPCNVVVSSNYCAPVVQYEPISPCCPPPRTVGVATQAWYPVASSWSPVTYETVIPQSAIAGPVFSPGYTPLPPTYVSPPLPVYAAPATYSYGPPVLVSY